LIWNVRWIIDNHVECRSIERHASVVRNDIWLVPWIDVQTDNRPRTSLPEPAAIDRRVENEFRSLAGIEVQHPFQECGIVAFPDGRQHFVAIATVAVEPETLIFRLAIWRRFW